MRFNPHPLGRSGTVDIRDSLKLYLDAHDVVQAQLAKEAGMTRQKLNKEDLL